MADRRDKNNARNRLYIACHRLQSAEADAHRLETQLDSLLELYGEALVAEELPILKRAARDISRSKWRLQQILQDLEGRLRPGLPRKFQI